MDWYVGGNVVKRHKKNIKKSIMNDQKKYTFSVGGLSLLDVLILYGSPEGTLITQYKRVLFEIEIEQILFHTDNDSLKQYNITQNFESPVFGKKLRIIGTRVRWKVCCHPSLL